MVGYTESLTDPSYEGQILILTYPLIGNYGVPRRPGPNDSVEDLPEEFESSRVHIAGLVVGSYSEDFSHFLASSSLGEWLKENDVPAIFGVDTRALTKRIRENGTMLGKLLVKKEDASPGGLTRSHSFHGSRVNSRPPSRGGSGNGIMSMSVVKDFRADYMDIPLRDPNRENLVAAVSITKPCIYHPIGETKMHPSGRPIRVLVIDVGMKYNQIRCFIRRGVELKVVPWDYDFLSSTEEAYDGLFISNGPGDPTTLTLTIDRLKKAVEIADKPIFGICLGHQLLALAAGCTTSKMKYGNRGHNIPCIDSFSGRCYITSQNHGFQVDTDSLPEGWNELFRNANDNSNEGIFCVDKPFFSVQFHPES